VNGAGADPLYAYLRAEAPGQFGPADGRLFEHVRDTRPEAIGTDEIKWNFTKFLVDRHGNVAGRYEPTVTPEQLRPDLDALLTG
jgi:glutathione peroxidase